MHCMSPKSGSWNQFSSSIATALICLSTGRTYNFSRFILEGMIGNVKAPKQKFLMYPQFLQMILAFKTADRTPRPTSAFTKKMFANMKFRWAQDPVPLTPSMMAIAAGGNAASDAPAGAAAGGDAADEANVVANDAAGGAAEASQTFLYEEPIEFGPVPRPTGYVDPNDIEPIFFGPQPGPIDYVKPDFEVPIFFGPQPRPDNYVEPEEPDVIISMEDDTIHGGFHVESPVRSNDAPKPTADAAGRAEDPFMLTILFDKLDMCMGCIATLKKDLGTSKQVMGGAILKLVNRVKRLEKQAHLQRRQLVIADSDEEAEVAAAKEDDIDLDEITALATAALGSEQPAVPTNNVKPMEEQEEMEVPLTRKQSTYRRARTQFHTPAFTRFRSTISTGVPSLTVVPEPAASYVALDTAGPSVPADKGKAPMPDLDIPAEFLIKDAQARKRLEEEQASEQADWLNLMIQVGSDPTLARELLGADVNEDNFIPRMNALKEWKKRALADLRYRALQNKPMKKSEVIEFMRAFVK
nr:hypothetical protein [Tanacetum cinerariifolium]